MNPGLTLDSLKSSGRATVTIEESAQILGLSRSAAYRAAQDKSIPTLRLGRKLLVPVPRLLAMLEDDR